jgi:hypothetical protein
MHGAAVFIGRDMHGGTVKDVSFKKSFQKVLYLKIVFKKILKIKKYPIVAGQHTSRSQQRACKYRLKQA